MSTSAQAQVCGWRSADGPGRVQHALLGHLPCAPAVLQDSSCMRLPVHSRRRRRIPDTGTRRRWPRLLLGQERAPAEVAARRRQDRQLPGAQPGQAADTGHVRCVTIACMHWQLCGRRSGRRRRGASSTTGSSRAAVTAVHVGCTRPTRAGAAGLDSTVKVWQPCLEAPVWPGAVAHRVRGPSQLAAAAGQAAAAAASCSWLPVPRCPPCQRPNAARAAQVMRNNLAGQGKPGSVDLTPLLLQQYLLRRDGAASRRVRPAHLLPVCLPLAALTQLLASCLPLA